MLRQGVEVLKSDMPFSIVLRQFATLCAMPGIDKTTAHVIQGVPNMHLQVLSFVLFTHGGCLLADRTAALKSSINRSTLSKR
jgi:hypothetical protein